MMDEKGVLTIEYSLVFPVCIFLTVLAINVLIIVYERTNEILVENSALICMYENTDESTKVQYDKEKSLKNESILSKIVNVKKYNSKRDIELRRTEIKKYMNSKISYDENS